MKKWFTLSVFAALFLQAQAQQGYVLTGLNLMQNTATTRCDTTINLSFWAQTAANNAQSNYTLPFILTGNNFVPSQFQFAVNWGDGSTNNYNGGVSSSGVVIPVQPSPQHTYPGPGTYTIVVAAFNFANQTTAVDTVVMTLGSCQLPVYSMFQVDCNNDGIIDSSLTNVPVPLIITGSGQTYTGTTQNNFYNFTGIEPGLYTLNIDPSWLAAHNYTVGNFQGPAALSAGSGAQTVIFTLHCGNGGGNPGPMCVQGQLYCDQNNDGQFNGNDTPLANAPVVVNYGNGSMVVYTNQQGNYTASYNGAVNGMAIVSLNANWMNQHGYTANMVMDTVMNMPCNAGAAPPIVSFPVHCGGNNGNPNCYSGFVFCDSNNNGIMDAGELPLVNAPVTLSANPQNNINSVIVYTDTTGHFTYCGALSNTNFVLANINANYLTSHGYTANFALVTISGNQTAMLPVNCGGGGGGNACADLWTTVTPWIGYFQNSTAYIRLNWGNYGPMPSGPFTMTLTFPAGVTVNTGSINTAGYTIAGNTITWNLSNMNSGYNANDIITFNVPGGIAAGTQHYFTSTITPNGNFQDCHQQNNAGSLLQIVGNSYDPNDKNVNKSDYYINSVYTSEQIEVGIVDVLSYTIRFQNTGNAPAQNIVVVDTLDPSLDWSTFSLVNSSHPVQVVNLGNGILHFEFNGIWLPDSTTNEPLSHGDFTYRIQENANNGLNSEITNTAHIFFDWNPAIVTNTTYNINTILEGLAELGSQVKLYPNPATSYFSLDAQAPFEYQLVDLSGRTVLKGSGNPMEKITLNTLLNGTYLLEVRVGNQRYTTKLLKQ